MAASGKDVNGRIRVQVTESDIKRAVKSNSMHCVVAQAIARTVPGASRIDVDLQSIRWSQDGERHIYLTPYSVQGYVIGFDAGDEIQPFTFALDSRRRVITKKQVSTAAGKKVQKAANEKRAAARNAKQLELAAAGDVLPPPSPAERAVAAEKLPTAVEVLEKAEQNLAKVKEAVAGKPQKVMEGE